MLRRVGQGHLLHDEALRLLLGHIADHSADPGAVRYRRAISYYAEHLNPPYDD